MVDGERYEIAPDYRDYMSRGINGAYICCNHPKNLAYMKQDLTGKELGWKGITYLVLRDTQEVDGRTLYLGQTTVPFKDGTPALIPTELYPEIS